MDRNFVNYHQSLGKELQTTKDRIRDLIGDAHWATDGQHKEAVLRRILRNHLADVLHVGTGFICGRDENSRQTDILITSKHKPTLFKDGELVLVTPDAVEAIIEVKTRLPNNLGNILKKLGDDVEMIRSEGNPKCKAGLFVYEPPAQEHRRLLQKIKQATRENEQRVINWLAAGPDLFIRFWDRGDDVSSPVDGPVWHSYELRELAHAYFISNVVWDTCPHANPLCKYAWFPVEGGKEQFRKWYVSLTGNPESFRY